MQSDSQSVDNSNPLNDLTKELDMLQKERLRAIDSCEFSKARAIDVHIDRLKERIDIAKQSTRQIQNVLQFELKKEEIQLDAIRRQTEARDNIFSIRQEFQERQMKLHKLHTDALTQVAEGYSAALEIESLRLNPVSETMVRQAKLNAQDKRYEIAEALFNESNMIREQSTLRRQEDVDLTFESKKAQLDKKHIKELELCAEKEETAIREVVEQFHKYINKYKNILHKTAYELQLQIQPEDLAFLDEFSLDNTEIQINSPGKSPSKSPRTPSKSPRTPRSIASKQLTPSSLRERNTPSRSRTSGSRNQTPISRKGTPNSTSKKQQKLSPRTEFLASPSPKK